MQMLVNVVAGQNPPLYAFTHAEYIDVSSQL